LAGFSIHEMGRDEIDIDPLLPFSVKKQRDLKVP
jgi:hypothetical protein